MTTETDGAPEGVTEDTAAAVTEADTEETQAQGDEQSGDDAAAADDEGEGEQPKPKKSPQERINEVTRARREAERERDYWRDLAMQSKPAPTPQAQQQQDDGEPDPSAYEHGGLDARFIRDHATFHARRTFQEEQAKLTRQSRVQTAIQTFEQRAEDLFPDGEPEGLERFRSLPTVSPAIQEVIMDSEIGPKLADYLGSHTRELNRISALSPLQQARELTKLELKLASPPAPSAKTVTDAPSPTTQVRGAGGKFKPAPDTDDFAAFEKTYGVG